MSRSSSLLKGLLLAKKMQKPKCTTGKSNCPEINDIVSYMIGDAQDAVDRDGLEINQHVLYFFYGPSWRMDTIVLV